MKRLKVLPALVSAGCFALMVGAPRLQAQAGDAGGSMTQTGGGNASTADKMFVKKAMAGGMAEVQLGQLATQKGSSDDVKQFGQKMVDDHTKLNDQMKPIASQLGISPPTSIPPAEQALATKLQGLSGDKFDRAYMQAMLKDHRQDLSEFKKESSSGKNPQVKEAAEQGSQVIQQHLQMAQQIAQKVGAAGQNMTNKSGSGSVSTPSGPQ
ncbi:DUF4142 domain-containing protein [Acidobacteria bacterium AB60]|nr:DUF4142 domain-containing protein [Acidobacteria bacterium AB60]